jgi:hypothetical protein
MPQGQMQGQTLATSFQQGDSSTESLKSAVGQLNEFFVHALKEALPNSTTHDGKPLSAKDRSYAYQQQIAWFARPGDNGLPPESRCTWENLQRFDQVHNFRLKDLDRFAKFLAIDARQRRKGRRHLHLAFLTADRYLSAIKCAMINHGYLHEYRHVLTDDRTAAQIRGKMHKIFIDRHMRLGTPLSNSHTTATANDLVAITLLCVYYGDAQFAQLAFFIMLLFHLAGRAGEVAAIPYRNVRVDVPPEFEGSVSSDVIMNFSLWRMKTASHMQQMQDLSVFNHRDEWKKCVPFLMGYSMLMQNEMDPGEQLFPAFYPFLSQDERALSQTELDEIFDGPVELPSEPANAASATPDAGTEPPAATAPAVVTQPMQTQESQQSTIDDDENDGDSVVSEASGEGEGEDEVAIDSRVAAAAAAVPRRKKRSRSNISNHIAGLLQRLLNHASALSEFAEVATFNHEFSTHSPKRCAVNFLNTVAGLKVTWSVFRCGWMAKAMHTIFDYLDKSPNADRKCARASAGWPISEHANGNDQAGRPPRIAALGFVSDDPERDNFPHYGAAFNLVGKLFHRYVDAELIDWDMANYLFSVILLNFRSFISDLTKHPQKKYGDGLMLDKIGQGYRYDELADSSELKQDYLKVTDHPFIQKLHNQAVVENCDLFTLLYWSEVIEKDFVRRNFNFVSFQRIVETHPDEPALRVDTRTISSGLASLSTYTYDLKIELSEQRRQVDGLTRGTRRDLNRFNERLCQLERKTDSILEGIKCMLGKRGRSSMSAPESACPLPVISPESSEIYEPNGSRPKRRGGTVVAPPSRGTIVKVPKDVGSLATPDIFKRWLIDRWYLASSKGNKSTNTKISNLRQIVAYYSLFLTSPIPAIPPEADGYSGSNQFAKRWREEFFAIADSAWVSVTNFFENLLPGNNGYKTGTKFKKLMHAIDDEEQFWPCGLCPRQQEECYLRQVSRMNGNPIKNRLELLQCKRSTAEMARKRKATIEAKRRAAAEAEAAERAAEVTTATAEAAEADDDSDNLAGFAGFTRI